MPVSQWQILVVFPSEEMYEMVCNRWTLCQDWEEIITPALLPTVSSTLTVHRPFKKEIRGPKWALLH